MKSNILIITLVLASTVLFGQKTKKITFKNEYPSYKEIFYVLKSDQCIKHGRYEKEFRGKVSMVGQFDNGEKSGVWEYYDSNRELVHRLDVKTNTLLYDKFAEQSSGFDTTKYSRPLIVLGGFNSMFYKIAHSLRYPPDARRRGTQGKVTIKLVVGPGGGLKDVQVVEGIGDGCDEEAVRVVKLIGFESLPALDLDGQPTESEIIFPISFTLG